MAGEFDAAGPLEIVEDKVGTGSTDFWGISFSPSAAEQGPMGEAELERGITLLRACWAFFDGVAARVSPELRKGPRGGGRDRPGQDLTHQREEPLMPEVVVDFITSRDGYGAAKGWPGWWGLEGPEYLAWLRPRDAQVSSRTA
jgi:hypothetical protein